MNKRTIVALMCAIATFICYIDRVNISVAIIPMTEEFGWSGTTKGFVLSSFFIGYMAAMLPTGWLANKFGGRVLMGVALAGWSLFTVLTPIAAGISLTALIVTRILMGVGESASFPAVYNLLARWFPKPERSRAAAMNLTGIPLGTIFALSTSGWLVTHYGWHSVFYAFGALGLAFSLVWFWLVRARPSAHPHITEEERALLAPLEADIGTTPATVPWKYLFSHSAVWALVVNHFCANWTLYLMLSWLPSYFRDVQHMSIEGSGLFSILPWVSQFVVGNASAHVADNMIARGWRVTHVRKIMQCTGLGGGAVFLLFASQAATPGIALFTMCGALGIGSLCWAGFASNHLDIAPRHADVLWSISNTAGTLPGIIGVMATGILLDLTGGYTATFIVAAAINVGGAIVWLIWGTGERIVD
ncbi:MAG: ACS family MFS transporter [Sphingomonadales bacterium]|jgi:ACS family sodium-dependent inorganic phosphate cotransporter|nr:ACS family MFS transporter [Sphingomonadales bacterium]MBK6718584.1 ACS family MFS transporter [Sphingomonadales bacterium]MBK8272395.1 ACS family MFS transporter [Sphingomonadales bacterium]MBK8862277.1 ACS family MFS transporter [Sphingomonadales bacterium]